MSSITPVSPTATRPVDNEESDPFAPGKWCWVNETNSQGEPWRWLGCVIRHGSNYVYLEGHSENGAYSHAARVHVRDLYTRLTSEPNADAVIATKVGYHQNEVNTLLGRIKDVTNRLGVVPKTAVADQTGGGDNALVQVTEVVDTTAYKQELIKAKDEDLPALFKQVEEQHKRLATWMKAPILPMQAAISPMKDSIKQIEDRIYTVELYAGLTEHSEKIKDGDPATTDTPLHVMQRRLYMDEECLLDYDLGGMEFKDIRGFDAWLCRPHNLDRILPFNRCMVGFQVRRNAKERYAKDLWQAFVNIQLEQMDKFTFFYIRNGEQVWRIGCDFEFGEMLFPDADQYDPANGGYMMEMFAGGVRKIITTNEYEVGVAEDEQRIAEWRENNPDADKWREPSRRYRLSDYEPLSPASVYYDDGMEMVDAEVKQFNRIAVILQGLFDRSLCLHPHHPVSVWDSASFMRSVKLIYDATVLTYGDKPDYKAYVAKLRESLGPNSVTIGQALVWMQREAERENNRTANSWREKPSYHDTYAPYGDPGPGYVARITEWKPRAKKAVYRWTRESRNWRTWDRPDEINCSVTVEAERLFNISAYQPGDFLQFFQDPRTRAEYLKWAPLLLTAEEFHAGNPKYKDI